MSLVLIADICPSSDPRAWAAWTSISLAVLLVFIGASFLRPCPDTHPDTQKLACENCRPGRGRTAQIDCSLRSDALLAFRTAKGPSSSRGVPNGTRNRKVILHRGRQQFE